MKKQKITTIKKYEDMTTGEIKETTNTIIEIKKTWDELTREEKEKEIEKNQELIYQYYQDDLAACYDCDLENIKDEYKNINFDYVYLDSNSQGGWIDSIKNFKYQAEPINIYGEDIEINDIYLHIRKYIEEITADDIDIYEYYIDNEKLEKIKATKKYQKWINNIVKDVNNWIDAVNDAAKIILSKEYYCPYNMDDEEDADYLNYFFSDSVFTFEEDEEGEKNE